MSTSWNKIPMRITEKIHIAAKHNHVQKAVGLFQGEGGMTINLLAASFCICTKCCYL